MFGIMYVDNIEAILSLFTVIFGCATHEYSNMVCINTRTFSTTNVNNISDLYVLGLEGPLVPLTKNKFLNSPDLREVHADNCLNDIEEGAFNGVYFINRMVLKNNHLPILKPRMFDNLVVDKLWIENCKVEDIEPHTFDNLESTFIKITGNHITSIKRGIFTGTNFVRVDLSNNKLHHIEDGAFANMQELCNINFENNHLQDFDAGAAFGASMSLKAIDLTNNRITKVEKSMFRNLPNLEIVVLTRNQIRHIGFRAFAELQKLETLDLAENKIRELRPHILPDTSVIKHLFVNNNYLEFLSEYFLMKLPKLEDVLLNVNPWSCACYDDLKMWLSDMNVTRTCQHLETCVQVNEQDNACAYGTKLSEKFINEYTEENKIGFQCESTGWIYALQVCEDIY